ncbi:hypothetical protein MmTuc01_3157 [Methanosarcina mazei Tuc01]|uniref:Uncharacterized protein n=1 Tax=Methanosarcina mazei Tuc01 TaxID=1236903 RepID=M1QN21_METMZ|nr:hypothetical protein MmTuc01_3157 [Methanosarcina mazei Tuc01]
MAAQLRICKIVLNYFSIFDKNKKRVVGKIHDPLNLLE